MPESAHVLVVSTTLNHGGAERFVSTLLSHLDRTRIRPSLCLLRHDIGYPLPDDVPLHSLCYQRPWHFPRTVQQVRAVIDTLRPDVVLSNVTATNLVCGLALRRCPHQPVWIARIGTDPVKGDTLLRAAMARATYARVDRFVVNSRGLLGSLVHRYPVSKGRIKVIANPTDFREIERLAALPPEWTKPDETPLLVAAGRLAREKRYDLLLDAFAQLHARREARLWICGEGPLRTKLERRIAKYGLERWVRLLGYQRNPYTVLRQATLFVMSSDYEGLPNALIEAQGLGIPAVSTRCPQGPDEIIEDGETGLLVPVGDAAALSEALFRLLCDRELRERMGESARRLARQRFAVEPLTRAWERVLSEHARLPNTTAMSTPPGQNHAGHLRRERTPLRVLFVSASLTGGGAERLVSTLLGHLDRQRYRPSLCLLKDDVSYPLPADVSLTTLHKRKPWHLPRTLRRLHTLIERSRPDVVVSNMLYTNWLTALALAGGSYRPRWIARFAADPYSEYGRWFNIIMRPVVGRLLRRAAAHVANSVALAERSRRYFHLSHQAVNTILNPLDFDHIEAAASEPLAIPVADGYPIVLAVGRLDQQKRLDVLIDAFAQVRRTLPARLWICGEGPLRKPLRRRIAALGLQDDVTLWGFQSNPYAFMRRASLFALTSDFEGMPNALLEAQALGLPVVSTRCPTGPDEIVEEGLTGHLVPPGDVQAVAEALLGLLANPEQRTAMGKRAQQRMHRLFDLHTIISQWHRLLGPLAESKTACVA